MSLNDQLAAAAARAGDDATRVGIEARMWAILLEWRPDRADIVDQHRLYAGIAATKSARAEKLAARAAVPETTSSDGLRAELAALRAAAEEEQELLEEKAEHADLWGFTPEEAALEQRRMGWRPETGAPPPPVDTPGQLRANALMGRARVQSLREWFDAHPDSDVTVPEGESTTPPA